jgi:hypothetical protein
LKFKKNERTLKSAEEKKISGDPQRVNDQFFILNHRGRKAMVWHVQSAKR